MPNKANAKKAMRQNEKRAALNLAKKTAYKNAVRQTLKTTTKAEAIKSAHSAQKALDKAAKHGTIKKNTAARKMSRLMKKINKLT